jgi:hypothetical protein
MLQYAQVRANARHFVAASDKSCPVRMTRVIFGVLARTIRRNTLLLDYQEVSTDGWQSSRGEPLRPSARRFTQTGRDIRMSARTSSSTGAFHSRLDRGNTASTAARRLVKCAGHKENRLGR